MIKMLIESLKLLGTIALTVGTIIARKRAERQNMKRGLKDPGKLKCSGTCM
jgi:hypothetical protein